MRSPQRITPVDERPAEPPVPVSLRAALGVLGSAGVSPKPTLGLRVEGRARWPSVSLGVEGRFDLPRATDIEQSAVSASVLAATLSPCLHHAAFLACALITAGALRGEGQRLDGARSVTTPFAAGGGRLGAEIAIGEPFALVLHADVLAAFTRTSLLVGGAEAWRSAPVSVALGGALVLEIP